MTGAVDPDRQSPGVAGVDGPSERLVSSDPTVPRPGFDARVSALASLGDPTRRRLYRYVVSQDSAVNREQAAKAVGVAHHVAKFHLDKLVDDGLLKTQFARPPGRSGPGAGRPAKHYLRSALQVEVSVPERRYDLAGWLLARAVTSAEHDERPVGEALVDAARDAGESFGRDARARAGRRPSRSALVAAVRAVLDELGYESRSEDAGLELANCPYHAMAEDYTDVVCGMNLQLLAGVADGAGLTGLDVRLDPRAGRCCVRLCDKRRPPRQR